MASRLETEWTMRTAAGKSLKDINSKFEWDIVEALVKIINAVYGSEVLKATVDEELDWWGVRIAKADSETELTLHLGLIHGAEESIANFISNYRYFHETSVHFPNTHTPENIAAAIFAKLRGKLNNFFLVKK